MHIGPIWFNLVQFDKHIDYEKVKNVVQLTKAVDFIGILDHKSIFLFEIKSFKDHRIENKDRLKQSAEELTTEIAQKVRDSIACIVAGCRNSTNDKEFWREISAYFLNKNIIIVLWLEQQDPLNKNTSLIADYQQKLQSKLKWLTGVAKNIRIVNTNNYKNEFKLNVSCE